MFHSMRHFLLLLLLLPALYVRGADPLPSLSVAELRTGALAGLATHQAWLAYRYQRGDGIRRNLAFAREWAKKAMAQEHPVGTFILGLLYRDGRGVPRDPQRAAKYFSTAFPALLRLGRTGDSLATAYAGVAYMQGAGCQEDPQQAAILLKSVANEISMAQTKLGLLTLLGVGVPRDAKQALACLRQAAAAGDPEAALLLAGQLLHNSRKKQQQKALHYLRQAARVGYGDAQFLLARTLEKAGTTGTGASMREQRREIAEWYAQAAEQGCVPAEIAYARLLANGLGNDGRRDLATAGIWYHRAATAGNAEAQNQWGWMLLHGLGVDPAPATAASWFKRAAKTGHAEAQYRLAWMYLHGQGVPHDPEQAFFWNHKAAKQGYPRAEFNSGVMFDSGIGVSPNLKQAATWYRRAALQGMGAACFNLANLLEHGSGVNRDEEKAWAWYENARRLGVATACIREEQLEKKLTMRQQRQAKKWAQRFRQNWPTPDRTLDPASSYRRAGSGWMLDSGYLLTSSLLLGAATRANVLFPRVPIIQATVVRKLKKQNLAILRLDTLMPPPGLALASRSSVAPGSALVLAEFRAPELYARGPEFRQIPPEQLRVTPAGVPRTLLPPFSAAFSGAPLLNFRAEIAGVLLPPSRPTAQAMPSGIPILAATELSQLLSRLPALPDARRIPRLLRDFSRLSQAATPAIALVFPIPPR